MEMIQNLLVVLIEMGNFLQSLKQNLTSEIVCGISTNIECAGSAENIDPRESPQAFAIAITEGFLPKVCEPPVACGR